MASMNSPTVSHGFLRQKDESEYRYLRAYELWGDGKT
jgi:hypothetical protein